MNQQLNDQLDDLTPLTEMILEAEARLRPAIAASLEKDGTLANLDKVTIIIARMVNMRKSLARMKADIAKKKNACLPDNVAKTEPMEADPAMKSTPAGSQPTPSDPGNPSPSSRQAHGGHSPVLSHRASASDNPSLPTVTARAIRARHAPTPP